MLLQNGFATIQATWEFHLHICYAHRCSKCLRRVIANKQQNLWDEQIRELSDNGGILAIHFCSRLVLGVDDRQSAIPDVISQIKYVKNRYSYSYHS